MSLAPVEDESARRQRQATHPVRRSLTPVPLSAVAEHGDDATATPGSTAAGHKRASRSAGNVHMMGARPPWARSRLLGVVGPEGETRIHSREAAKQ